MSKSESGSIKKWLDRMYGGLSMSWLFVILLAVGTAVLTSVFLILPVFKDTSFNRMGVYFEAWIFFAVLIMANCKKPLESALKTFVFFLISQPLIYLIQIPFSSMGWGLFGYYKYWFIWTMLTFPMAFVGWYITKRNWLSAIILAPVLAYLGRVFYESCMHCIRNFPNLLVTALFCLLQIILYLIAFLPEWKQKLVIILIIAGTIVILAVDTSSIDVNSSVFLPNDPILTESAVVETEKDSPAEITIENTGEDSMIHIHATKECTTDFTIRDGETEYLYTAKIYEDEGRHIQIQITER